MACVQQQCTVTLTSRLCRVDILPRSPRHLHFSVSPCSLNERLQYYFCQQYKITSTTNMLRLVPRLSRTPLRSLPLSTRSYASRAQPTDLGQGEKIIWEKLNARFPSGSKLQVQDVSGGCGSFFAIEISSPEFKGKSVVKQHKLVNECLKDEIKDIHGLQVSCRVVTGLRGSGAD